MRIPVAWINSWSGSSSPSRPRPSYHHKILSGSVRYFFTSTLFIKCLLCQDSLQALYRNPESDPRTGNSGSKGPGSNQRSWRFHDIKVPLWHGQGLHKVGRHSRHAISMFLPLDSLSYLCLIGGPGYGLACSLYYFVKLRNTQHHCCRLKNGFEVSEIFRSNQPNHTQSWRVIRPLTGPTEVRL